MKAGVPYSEEGKIQRKKRFRGRKDSEKEKIQRKGKKDSANKKAQERQGTRTRLLAAFDLSGNKERKEE